MLTLTFMCFPIAEMQETWNIRIDKLGLFDRVGLLAHVAVASAYWTTRQTRLLKKVLMKSQSPCHVLLWPFNRWTVALSCRVSQEALK